MLILYSNRMVLIPTRRRTCSLKTAQSRAVTTVSPPTCPYLIHGLISCSRYLAVATRLNLLPWNALRRYRDQVWARHIWPGCGDAMPKYHSAVRKDTEISLIFDRHC